METRELENLSRYLIREDGAVMVKELILPHNKGGYRKTKPKWLAGQISQHGYLVYHLKQDDGKTKVHKVHRLVCKCWHSGEKPTVNHIDGNKLNNHYTNLEWATYAENTQHSFAAKLNGEHCYSNEAKERRRQGSIIAIKKRRKLPFEVAEVIRSRVANGEKQKDLAKEYGVSKSTICEINKGIRYAEK
jgi:DNA-binding XRE family transcriptional regulator